MDTAITRDGPFAPPMQVFKTGRPPKLRRVFKMEHCGPTQKFGVHNNTLKNLRRGLLERVFFVELDGELRPPPRPVAEVFRGRLGAIRARLSRVLPKLTPWTDDQFVGTYDGQRKQIYAQAAESLRARALRKQDAYLKTFVKAEKINFTLKPDPAPRVIQPRDPRYILETGRYLKQLEHPLYKALDGMWGGPTVMKGHTFYGVASALREKWDSYRKPVAVGLDASRFDQHVSDVALAWEHAIYRLAYKGEDAHYLAKILQWQIDNRGTARASDGYIKYRVRGCRGSGDINTAMGNCLLMCAMMLAWCEEVGLKAQLANNGDDCVLFFEQEDLHKLGGLPQWFTEMGFTMKVEAPVYEFEHIEFCQSHPVWTPEGWIMTRNLKTALGKDSMSLLDMRAHGRRVFDAVGRCGLALAGGIPIFNEFYAMMVRNGSPKGALDVEQDRWFNGSGFYRMSRGMTRCYSEVHPRTRYSFWRAFGVTPDAQEAIEGYYKEMTFQFTVRDYVSDHSLFPELI